MHVIHSFNIRSGGIIHDFACSESISIDNFTFGEPYKFVELNPNQAEKLKWDDGVKLSDIKYSAEDHNLF